MDTQKLDALREDLQRNLKRGRAIDWDLIEPFLRVPHDPKAYRAPTDAHGTHVAGILAANWPEAVDTAVEAPLIGMSPHLKLMTPAYSEKGPTNSQSWPLFSSCDI